VSETDPDAVSVRAASIVAATVVLPTIGRPELIRACLESLARCDPRAEEILVVDSSDADGVADAVTEFEWAGAHRIYCAPDGLGSAFNLGLREAKHEIVLLTNDDCTVEQSWVEAGRRHSSQNPDAIVTGRVRPRGDPSVVPSTIDDVNAHEYSGATAFVLYTQCMALHRSAVLGFGGFDGRIRPSAEDNDLSYRWLRAGRRVRYEPDFVAWHEDWRTREQLEVLYVNYGVGQGMVYGKHLRRGDLAVVRYLADALYGASRAALARVVLGRRNQPDPRLGLLRGLPEGLLRGWRVGADPVDRQANDPRR
jgi:glycosyltransferase involved in cell wall biosynthesis